MFEDIIGDKNEKVKNNDLNDELVGKIDVYIYKRDLQKVSCACPKCGYNGDLYIETEWDDSHGKHCKERFCYKCFRDSIKK